MRYEVRIYKDANDDVGLLVGCYTSMSAARAAAADALGHVSLRGSRGWATRTGRVYYFGRGAEVDRVPVVELLHNLTD